MRRLSNYIAYTGLNLVDFKFDSAFVRIQWVLSAKFTTWLFSFEFSFRYRLFQFGREIQGFEKRLAFTSRTEGLLESVLVQTSADDESTFWKHFPLLKIQGLLTGCLRDSSHFSLL